MPGLSGLNVGARIVAKGRGPGILAMDNEDGTWNVDFDDGTEENVKVEELELHTEQVDWAGQREASDTTDEVDYPDRQGLRARGHRPRGEDSGTGEVFNPLGVASAFGMSGPSAAPGFLPAEEEAWHKRNCRAEDTAWFRKVDAELANGAEAAERRRSRLSLLFLVIMAGPGLLGVLSMVYEWMQPPLIALVPPGDSAQIEQIFFGGTPWLIVCVTATSAKAKAPKTLEQAAEILRPRGVRVARVHCWEPLQTKKGLRTLAKRFGFRDKPPVVMASTGSGKPALMAATGLSAEALAAKALAATASDLDDLPKVTVQSEAGSKSRRKRDVVGQRPQDFENPAHEEDLHAGKSHAKAGSKPAAEKDANTEEEDDVVDLDG